MKKFKDLKINDQVFIIDLKKKNRFLLYEIKRIHHFYNSWIALELIPIVGDEKSIAFESYYMNTSCFMTDNDKLVFADKNEFEWWFNCIKHD